VNSNLKFPIDKLLEDLEMQRKYIRKMIDFKNKITDRIDKDDLLFVEVETDIAGENNETTDEIEIDKNIVNTVINLNDSISASFETLNNTYHKFSKNIETIQKAIKINNDSKPKEFDIPKKKIDPSKLLNKGHNLFNVNKNF
jgi:hypothetical protein